VKLASVFVRTLAKVNAPGLVQINQKAGHTTGFLHDKTTFRWASSFHRQSVLPAFIGASSLRFVEEMESLIRKSKAR